MIRRIGGGTHVAVIKLKQVVQENTKDCDASLGERLIGGGCWANMGDVKPPCGKLFRYGDACYRPVAADPTKPVGMLPDSPGQP